ncbi:substrate-binding domain-containing protein [Fodinicurvata sp. EGI_FJ10296]|uniref:substrate-binding domain-containing protein n=1 Tax=Fodinicurvata sp. EGI_FJ10296 TaxID=3231908 RepID=UPI003454FAA4
MKSKTSFGSCFASGVVAASVAAGALMGVGSAQAQDLTIASSMPALEFPFFVHMQAELRREAEEIGGIELIETDGQNSTSKQTADVEAAIVRDVDGIIISPSDAVAMAPALSQAAEAGIPIITIDRRVEGVDDILAHVGADNVLGGEAQGRLIMELFPDGARVVNLQGQPGASPAIDRNQGVHNVLDQHDEYEFIAEQTANFAREEGASVTESILAGLDTPPDVIVAANDDMALGALITVQEMELDIPIIGFDALPEALGSIRDGGLAATIEQFPGGQSRTALQAMVDYLRDGTEPESLILLEPIAITADNIDEAERLGEL